MFEIIVKTSKLINLVFITWDFVFIILYYSLLEILGNKRFNIFCF